MDAALPVPQPARRATLSMLPLGAFETGPDGGWDFVSPALVEMLGDLPVSSLLGREWLNLVHKDDFQRVLAEYRQAREFQRPWRQNFRIVTSDGNVLHIGVDASPMPQDPDQRGVQYVGLVRDRTSIVRAEARQAESLAFVEQLLEATHEGVVINRVDVTVAANTAAARIFGFDSPDEMVGLRGADRVHPDDLATAMRFAQSDDESYLTLRFRRKDGSYVRVALQGRQTQYMGAPARLITFVALDDPLVTTALAARAEQA